ncbi:hypothetical protein AD998_20665 [bacterium 336/3]|nr:hypothetical protein AD998_20665 [bacterium 336/3]
MKSIIYCLLAFCLVSQNVKAQRVTPIYAEILEMFSEINEDSMSETIQFTTCLLFHSRNKIFATGIYQH